jgi:hypothetical protein
MWSAIQGIIQLLMMLKDLVVLYQKAKQEGWLKDATETLERVKRAKTDEERKELARRLAEVGMFPR